ncbi:MAG TPA: Ig-like domain-containing protein, partial [Longimicrobium sp.]|nr:Ig-like domain-containing protein [Longimicrobium sp.]
MSRSRIFLASLAAVLAASACDNGSPNDPDPDWPPQGTLVSGNLQQATVGAQLADPIVVRVTDQDGDPVPGLSVTFAVTAGGGTLFAATAQTNASGEASNRWTLGTVAADTQRVEARVIDPESGQPVVLATFLAIGRADVPASITARPPAARTGSAGQPLADSLEALVQDRHGNPVPGATVTWLATSGGGSVSPATTTTGANGIARASWTLGRQIGTQQTAEASLSPAVRAQFTATAGVPVGAVLVKVSGDTQNGTVGTSLGQPAVVEARTSVGLPLQGVSITWTPATGSGTATPPVSITGPDGRASTTWTVGTTPGAITLMASADGVTPVTFEATANPGAPAGRLAIVDGDGQTAPPTALLPRPLAVRATDAFGNPLAGVTVTWAVTGGGGSIAPPSSQTDASGVAQAAWTLGATQGEQTAQASTPGTAPGTFTATAQVGPPAAIETTPSALTMSALTATAQLTARPVDAYGNPVSGVSITWTTTNAGVVNVSQSGMVTAMGNGTAQVRASGGGQTGVVEVTVQQAPATITVSTRTTTVVEFDTVIYSAAVFDAAGQPIPGAGVTWSTGNADVATVSSTGVVTGQGTGNTNITATASNGRSGRRGVNSFTAHRVDTLAVGAHHACTLRGGTAACWGSNVARQVGLTGVD